MQDQLSRISIKQLPVELLCSIFLSCCEIVVPESISLFSQTSESLHTSRIFQLSDPKALTHVSRFWRCVAIQLHPLWSFIKITKNTVPAKISLWLERSGNHPLDIVLDINGSDCHEIYYLLFPHVPRWKELHIAIPQSAHDDELYSLPIPVEWQVAGAGSTITPLELQKMELRNVRYSEDSLLYHLITSNPRLKRLVLVESEPHDWARFKPSLTQITWFEIYHHSYILSDPYFRHLMRAIGEMNSLQDLRLAISDHHEPDLVEEIGHPMTLLNLQTFKLYLWGTCTSLWAWLINLNAPRLWSLHIWPETSDASRDYNWHLERDDHGWKSLQDAIQLPSLTELVWIPDTSERCGECLTPLFRVIPSLIELTIQHPRENYDYSIQKLFPSDCRLPCLERVKINGWKAVGDINNRNYIVNTVSQWGPNVVVIFEEDDLL